LDLHVITFNKSKAVVHHAMVSLVACKIPHRGVFDGISLHPPTWNNNVKEAASIHRHEREARNEPIEEANHRSLVVASASSTFFLHDSFELISQFVSCH
jgi:hypothetical protein